MTEDLLQAVEDSEPAKASEKFKERIKKGGDPWEIHSSLFPLVQRVMNPPFINPHLPKMYRIFRELVSYVNKEEIPALVQLELTEYARRPKLEKLPKATLAISPVSFDEVESALRQRDWEKSAVTLAGYYAHKGGRELARRLLLLGSGYLNESLGHSLSCTAFILLEMIDRRDQDPWPALATLSDYFCRGQFHTTPPFRESTPVYSDDDLNHHLLRATSGRGIINLHHTITRYAIERVRNFFSFEEYQRIVHSWVSFLGGKKAQQVAVESPAMAPVTDYPGFYETFSRWEGMPAVAVMEGMISTRQGRRQLGRFLIKGVCDQYQGHYNPHYLTGLGTALWVIDRYWDQPPIVMNALYQYVDFFFGGLKSDE